MKHRPTLILTLVASFVAGAAFGHDTWIIADQLRVPPKTTVTLDLTSAVEFPKLEIGPKPENVPNVSCRLAGKTFEVTEKSPAPQSLQFKTELSEAGIAAIWIKLPSRPVDLKPEQVKMFNDEVNAPAELQKEYDNMPEPKRWRGTSTKHPKTFVRVGDPKNDTSWKEPVGLFLEIIPEKDPTALSAGDEFPVRVMRDGAPFGGFALHAVTAGDKEGQAQKTDANGRATFKLNKAGRWMVKGVESRKSTQPDLNFEARSATLTFEVAEK